MQCLSRSSFVAQRVHRSSAMRQGQRQVGSTQSKGRVRGDYGVLTCCSPAAVPTAVPRCELGCVGQQLCSPPGGAAWLPSVNRAQGTVEPVRLAMPSDSRADATASMASATRRKLRPTNKFVSWDKCPSCGTEFCIRIHIYVNRVGKGLSGD